MAYYDPTKPVLYSPEDVPAGVEIPPKFQGLSRRRLLQAMAASAGGAALAGTTTAANAAPHGSTRRRTGTIRDVEHVVILMQENRSFDHYFGTLPGVRGFGDKQALRYPDGRSVFHQPDPKRTDGGYLLPFRLETGKYNAQNANGLPHGWTDGHTAAADGKLDGWVAAKGEQTMGYFTGDDTPWQHALASAYTIADHYHCAAISSTSPNRMYMWSGMIDPHGTHHGPAIDNSGDYGYAYTWGTYPQELQKAGVSWQIYVNNDIDSNWFGDYTDNTLRSFAAFDPSTANSHNSQPRKGLLARANVLTTHATPPADVPNSSANLDYVLKDFTADCAAGKLPEVSWVVAPYLWSEHPAGAPDWGAVFSSRVIKSLQNNPRLWESTMLIMVFDENDGYFDHVQAPIAEPGTADEFVDGVPIGPGARVPLILVSPWTRGGYVTSEVFDHTSLIRFLETWTTAIGKPAISPNVSRWRRTVCGNLTNAIDFTSFDASHPRLPNTAVLGAAAVADAKLPSIEHAIPAVGKQRMPKQGGHPTLKPRPVPYQQHGRLEVDRKTGIVTALLSNAGQLGVSHHVVPDKYRPFAVTPLTVTSKHSRTYHWDTATTGGKYAFSVYGPDRFVRSFAGSAAASGTAAAPGVDVTLKTPGRHNPNGYRGLAVELTNHGRAPIRFHLTANDFGGHDRSVDVPAGGTTAVNWPADHNGYYDLVISVANAAGFRQRYAGRIQ